MKKFESTLLITDIDGTIVDRNYKISMENIDAVNYFIENGGTFTYATGRQVPVAKSIIDQLLPNAPVICFNGAAIYDYINRKYIWQSPLDNNSIEAICDVLKNCPEVNVEINTPTSLCVIKNSDAALARYEKFAAFFKQIESIDEAPLPWLKIVFVMQDSYMPILRNHIKNQPYFKNFQFSQSASFLYELLSYNVNKGTALEKLRELLGSKYKIIAIGDNENDIEFLKAADKGFAVANASPLLLAHSPSMTVHQKDHALAYVIDKLDKKII